MVPFASLPVDRETADQTSVGARLRKGSYLPLVCALCFFNRYSPYLMHTK